MIPRRLLFVCLVLAFLVALPTPPKTNSQLGALVQHVIRTIVLQARQGKVRVNLPDDMAAGDTVSGTVSVEPAGKTDNDRAKNASELNGLVIEVGPQRWPVSGGVIQRLTIPSTVAQPQIILLDAKGKKLDSAALPVNSASSPSSSTTFIIPALGQSGQPLLINGPFDGDASNTKVNIGGADTKVIAESPRGVIVETPKTVVGPTNVNVNENGNPATGNFRALKIDLTAPKTSLMRGESTELHVEVQGLQGITQPVPIQIQNQTPQNINLTGGNTQNIVVQPSQVTTGGAFNWNTNITGTGSGGFNITASVPGTSTSSNSSSTASPTPTPIYSPQVTSPKVGPATKEENFYASFASQDTDCCKKLISNGVLTFQDDKGNSFTIDHDKLKMVVDGKTYEWQFTQDGKPLWIGWMFCHLKDNQIVSQGTQVMAQRLQGGNTNESGGSTNISMAGPYRDEKTTRTYYGFQFTGLKIGTDNKEYGVSFTMDEETCKWSFQLFAEDKTVSYSNGPPGSTAQLYNYILHNSGLHTANSYTQPAWWNNMYRLAGELQTWNAWLATHPDDAQSGSLNAAFNLWSKMVQSALDEMEKSAGDQDKQLFNQMRALLATANPSPAQMTQIFWKFNDLWMRFRTGYPPA